ncbi:hypothetical protein RIT80_11240 [Streptococcus pneumoniae]|nr:hypothetical protein [Streptococcus pneumoniae]
MTTLPQEKRRLIMSFQALPPVSMLMPADIGFNAEAAWSEQQVAAPKQRERQRIVIEGDGEEQIAAFAENLRKVI